MNWFLVLVGLVVVERLVELIVSQRNTRWSIGQGAIEVGAGHYPAMVTLHTALLVGAVVEVEFANRPFVPALGWPMLLLVLLGQALRWWCVITLGRQWNTRIFVVPGMHRVDHGPYRLLSHPNYVAVVVEGVALPLVHTAWVTAVVFTALNAILLRIRISTEDEALRRLVPAERTRVES